jgi:hypothetical protein
MFSREPPSAPSSDEHASDPIITDTSLCCWCDDHDEEIDIEAYRRYYLRFDAAGQLIETATAPDGRVGPYSVKKKYKLIVPLKTGSKVTVQVRFAVEPQSGVSDTDVANAKAMMERGLNNHWNGKFTIAIEDRGCGTKSFPIEYRALWVAHGQHHYTMKVHTVYPRAGVRGFEMNVARDTSNWTFAHEFAHTVGVPDEYSHTSTPEGVKYYKPDGSLDELIRAPVPPILFSRNSNIMSIGDNTRMMERHAWNIAIEVRDLLTERLRRQVRCTIIA